MPTFHHHRSFWFRCDNWQEIYWIFLNHPFIRLFKSIYFCVSQFSFALLGTSISHQKSLLSRWCSFSPGGLWTRSLEGIHSENLPTLHHFCRQVTQHRRLGSLETNSEMSTTWHKICSCNFIYNYWIYVYVFSYVSCSCTNCVCPSSCLAGWFWEQWRVAVVGYLKSTDISKSQTKARVVSKCSTWNFERVVYHSWLATVWKGMIWICFVSKSLEHGNNLE